MSKNKDRRKGKYDQLKWETARELQLDGDLLNGKTLSARDAGRIGGQMVRKLMEAGEKSLEKAKPKPNKI